MREECINADEREKLRKRLRRVEGQVRGIARMVERDASCVEILTQIASARTAAEKVALLIVRGHTAHRVHESIKRGARTEGRDDELVAVERFLHL